ncbi:DM13 domain-containing protein [Patescibacteria group bacterium]|nr:DM13 domain-containing protein [Patescibacteria group bacterium]
MKRLLALATLSLLFTACSQKNGDGSMALAERLQNPLFAEYYAKMLVGRLTELEIDKDPILENEEKRKMIEKAKANWMEADREARNLQREGTHAELIGVKEYLMGEILILNNTLYIGPSFESDPGPGLSIFLSKIVDPRDKDFPDASSINIGPLQSPLGHQRYTIDPTIDTSTFRSIVFWDTELDRLYGFGQLYE